MEVLEKKVKPGSTPVLYWDYHDVPELYWTD
jgi:hypothetical protein